MQSLNFDFSFDKLTSKPENGTHACTSQLKGDWIIFRCSKCEDYERRLNWKTGEMTIKGASSFFMHQGFHQPAGVNLNQLNGN